MGYIVVTGGFAVELLTGHAYRTLDVDLIVSNPMVARILEKFLSLIGEKIARGYLPLYEEITVKSIDIVSTAYTRKTKPITIIIDSYKVYVDPPEELIITYLAGWKHWDSTEDRDKAIWLLVILWDKLDKKYLEERAREEDVPDRLKQLYKIIGSKTNY